jgi:hypothetical protein
MRQIAAFVSCGDTCNLGTARLALSRPSIDIGSVVDAQDPYDRLVVVDAVEQPIRAATGTELTGKFAAQRLTDAPWISGEVAEGELDDRGEYSRRQAVEITARGRGEANGV